MVIECSNSAYKRLQAIEINQRLEPVKEDLTTIFLYGHLNTDRMGNITSKAKKAKYSESASEEEQDILKLEQVIDDKDDFFDASPIIVNHPFLLGRLVLGDELDRFSEHGFTSKRNLARAVGAYCIGERESIGTDYGRQRIWRQGDYKSIVSLEDHGDLSVLQADVSGGDDSGVLSEPPTSGFGLRQDWSPFLYSVLRYAAAVGRDRIPEITQWQEEVRRLRTRNPWGNGYSESFGNLRPGLNLLLNRKLHGTGDDLPCIWINDDVLPSFRDGALDFLRNDKDGDVEICFHQQPARFDRVAHFVPDDIPHLLRANYQLFARDLDDLAQIMDWFNRYNQAPH